MAVYYSSSAGNGHSTGNPVISGGSGHSMAIWVKVDSGNSTAGSTYGPYNGIAASNGYGFRLDLHSTDYLGVHLGGRGASMSTTAITRGVWQHWYLQSTSGSIWDVFLDGVDLGIAYSKGPYGSSGGFDIRRYDVTTYNIAAAYAELAVWNNVLDAAEISALAKGYAPYLIRKQNLTTYNPLVGDGNGLSDPRLDLTLDNHSFIDHPRIIKT